MLFVDANQNGSDAAVIRLFSESNSRFIVEVPAELATTFEAYFEESTLSLLGQVCDHDRLIIRDSETDVTAVDVPLAQLKSAWLQPLNWS